MNPPILGPSWIPKIGSIIFIIGVALKKHVNPAWAFWSEPLESIGMLILGSSVRQNSVSSEQAGATKAPDSAVAQPPKAWLPLLLACAILGTGCAHVLPGNDPVIVRAQQTRAMFFEVMDTYLTLEYRNHQFLQSVNPEFARLANKLIAGNQQWFKSFDTVLVAYKAGRTDATRSKLIAAAAVLESALIETQACLAQAAAKGATP